LSLRGSDVTEAISCTDSLEIAAPRFTHHTPGGQESGLAITRACHKIWSHTMTLQVNYVVDLE